LQTIRSDFRKVSVKVLRGKSVHDHAKQGLHNCGRHRIQSGRPVAPSAHTSPLFSIRNGQQQQQQQQQQQLGFRMLVCRWPPLTKAFSFVAEAVVLRTHGPASVRRGSATAANPPTKRARGPSTISMSAISRRDVQSEIVHLNKANRGDAASLYFTL
jgi:hypothetical protein